MDTNEKLNLEEWFKTLDITWKRIFKQEIDINRKPTLSDIEKITNIESLDCRGSYIISLEPIQHFKKIKKLDISNTRIKKLDKISNCLSLEEINASNTEIKEISPLKNLINLKKLDISNTKVLSIDELGSIEEIIFYNTPFEKKEIELKGRKNESENRIVLDPLFLQAAEIVVTYHRATTSIIQRILTLGYSRANKIIDQLESTGIISTLNDKKVREVYFKDIDSLNKHLSSLNIPIITNPSLKKKKTKNSFWKKLFSLKI